MNPLKHYHGIILPPDIEAKLNQFSIDGLLHGVDSLSATTIPNGFHPDGKPAVEMPNHLFPCYTPFYLNIAYPSTLAQVPSGYSQTSAIAAIEWLEKTLDNPLIDKRHFNAELFRATIEGQEFRFAFPGTIIRFSEGSPNQPYFTPDRYAAVMTVADVSDNNADWEDGTIPNYIETQARFLLWCWSFKYGDTNSCPNDCFVVRITGNTPGDITVRTVHADPVKDSAIVKRVCKRFIGKDISTSGNIREQGTWFERKEQEREEAYVIQDENFYSLVRSYMEAKTKRKTLEAESKVIKERMEAIAIRLAAQTGTGNGIGNVKDTANNRAYSVIHAKKRTQSVTVSPDLVRQYYPEYADCIHTTEIARGRITIEAE